MDYRVCIQTIQRAGRRAKRREVCAAHEEVRRAESPGEWIIIQIFRWFLRFQDWKLRLVLILSIYPYFPSTFNLNG